MKKAIYFDMDGTIADLYHQPNWLERLRNEQAEPYRDAVPLISREDFTNIVNTLKRMGYRVGIISWLSKLSSEDFKKRVRKVKKEWLYLHYGKIFDEVHLVAYGTPKHKVAKLTPSILVDDNTDINQAWETSGGVAIHAKEIHRLLEIVK